jgi:hypothetical protein
MATKSKLTAKSESNAYVDGRDYPKRFVITVNPSKTDPNRVTVTRTCENMGGFELYGLLHAVLKAVEQQVGFPETQRSDGLVVSRADDTGSNDIS